MKILKDRKWQIVIGAVLVVIIFLVVILLLPKGKDNKDPKKDKEDDVNIITEKQIEEIYNFSSKDAIEIIKKEYNDDNYDYSTTVTMQGQYEVTVKNKLTESVDKYSVDPSTKTYYILIDDVINPDEKVVLE